MSSSHTATPPPDDRAAVREQLENLVVPNIGIAKAYDATGVTSKEVVDDLMRLLDEQYNLALSAAEAGLPKYADTADDVDMADLPQTLPDYYNHALDLARQSIRALRHE